MRNDIIELFTDIDDDLIAGAMPEARRPVEVRANTRRFSWGKFAAAAACLAVVIVGGAFALKAVSGKGGLVSSENAGSDNLNPGGSTVSDPYSPTVLPEPAGADYPEEAKYQYTGDFSELELCNYAEVDRMAYYSFDELVENSDIVVAGTFTDDARQDCPTDKRTFDLSDGASYNKLRVDKVFYGDVEIGSEIVIRDDTFVTDGKLMYIESSTLTPMIKGEQWVYFLTKQSPKYGDYYQPLFTEGRYPVPGKENTFVLTGSQHGVFEERYFHEDIYEDVKKMLGYVDGVEIIGEHLAADKEFTMPEFPGYKFIWKKGIIRVLRAGVEIEAMLFPAPGIVSVYLADINGDGKRELIFSCREETSGYIKIYDYANSKLYPFRPGAERSYDLEMRDNELYVVTQAIDDGKEVSAEPLMAFLAKKHVITKLPTKIPEFDDKTSTPSKSNPVEKIVNFDWATATTKEFTMPEFPEDKFIWKENKLSVLHDGTQTPSVLYDSICLPYVYLSDLNGDGKRELITTCLDDGAEMPTHFIRVYDYANKKVYPFHPVAERSYDLEMWDNELYVSTSTISDGEKVSSEPLTFDMLEPITRCGLDNLDNVD